MICIIVYQIIKYPIMIYNHGFQFFEKVKQLSKKSSFVYVEQKLHPWPTNKHVICNYGHMQLVQGDQTIFNCN